MTLRESSSAKRLALQLAVPLAIGEIEDQADDQPDDEPQPVGPAQAVDHGAAHDDAEDRNQRQQPER